MPGQQNGIGKRGLRRLSLTLALAAAALAGTAPAAAAERGFTITSFDRIRVEGPFVVTLTTGRPVSARATGDAAALDRLRLRVEGRTLLVRVDRTDSGFAQSRQGPLTIALSTPDLGTAILLGSGSLAIDRIKGARVILTVEGSGRLAVDAIEADNLSLAIAGSGRISAGGRARVGAAIARGAAEIDAPGLIVDDLVLTSESAGPVVLGARRSARVTASGLGPVRVPGSAACEVRQTGTGPLSCGSD